MKNWRSGPLGVPGFRLLAGGQFASTIGDYCYAVALPWLVLSGRHGSPALLGVVMACYGVPRLVLIPVGGVLADKIGPRLLMLCADTGRCVFVAGIAVLAARDTASVDALGPAAALIGAGEGLFLPASMSIIPSLLTGAQLQTGNAINEGLLSLGSTIGPSIGGALVATAGLAPAFWVDAASFAVSAGTLALISASRTAAALEAVTAPEAVTEAVTAPDAADKDEAAEDVKAPGLLALLRQERLLQVILLVVIGANFALAGATAVALPTLAKLHFGAGGYGAIVACLGAGSVVGTIIVARATRLRTPAVTGSFVFFGSAVLFGVVPFGGLPGAAAAMFGFGMALGFGNILFITMIQKWAPPAVLGRVMSLVMLGSFGSYPVSVLLAGALVRHIGAAPFFPIAGGVMFAATLYGLSQREFRELGARPAGEMSAAGEAPQDVMTEN